MGLNKGVRNVAKQGTVAAILAGGQGRRMGGQDKGLLKWQGRPMVSHVLDRLQPEGLPLAINANRNHDAYTQFPHPVIKDDAYIGAGPLAGMLAVMRALPAARYLFVPCDAPIFPTNLYKRLQVALEKGAAAVACAQDEERIHPIFALMSGEVEPALADYLASGGRRVQEFYCSVGLSKVTWPSAEQLFLNVNEPSDLAYLRAQSPIEPINRQYGGS